MPYQGTRTTQTYFTIHPSSRQDQTFYSRDLGLSKRLVLANAVFSGATLSGTGNFLVFKPGDMIAITNTQAGANNGDRTVLTVAAGSITCDFPFKTEGPTAGVEVRTQ